MRSFTGKFGWMKHVDFMLLDFVSLYLSFILAYVIKFHNAGCFTQTSWRILSITALLLDFAITLVISPYSGIFRRRFYEDVVKSIGYVLINFVVLTIFLYLFKIGRWYSRTVLILMYAFHYVLSNVLKYAWKQLVRTGRIRVNTAQNVSILLLTDADRAKTTLENVMASDMQLYRVVGLCLGENPEGLTEVAGIPVVGGLADFAACAIRLNAQEVLIDMLPGRLDAESYQRLAGNGITMQIGIETLIGFETEQQEVSMVGINKTLRLEEFSFTLQQSMYQGLKRVLDILFGLIGCLVLLPVLLFVKIAYLCTGDKAPILYTQQRIGAGGKPFRLYKIRSMVPDADKILVELLKDPKYRAEWDLNQKFEDDPRITRVGRFIRKTSLDELPQMVNVLKGDMSLVGPRPLIAGELEQHGGMKLYYKVKPGITGWWACNGRSNINYRERLDLEYYYVKHCSLYLDLLCLFRTALAVVSHKGAK